jgi:hypothetical protein
MNSDSEKIHYEETHENGFLERLLLDRRLTLASVIYFGCTVVAIGLAVFHLYVPGHLHVPAVQAFSLGARQPGKFR